MVFTLGLPTLATRADLGTISTTSNIVRFVLGRCRKNLPLGDYRIEDHTESVFRTE